MVSLLTLFRRRREAKQASITGVVGETDISTTMTSEVESTSLPQPIFTPSGPISISPEEQAAEILEPTPDITFGAGGGGGGGTPTPSSTGDSTPTPTPTPTPPPTEEPQESIIFLKEEEAGERGIFGFSTRDEVETTRERESIELAESLLGQDPGTSGAVGVPAEQLNLRNVGLGEGLVAVGDFAFGETGKQFIGIGGGLLPVVTAQEIKTGVRTLGLPGKVVGELIPTTPGEVAITGALVGAGLGGAKIVRAGISGGVGFFGTKTAFDPTQLPETRIAGGIVGGLGVAGFTAETLPFIRGAGARISGRFKPVETAPEGFQFVKFAEKDIGLIQPGKGAPFVELPKTSPLRRGGFGVKTGEKQIFLSKDQILATSQRGLFEAGKEIRLEKEFFVTPQDPFLKIAETRVSRLGLVEVFEAPKQIEIGFGLPPKPQIGITRAGVGRVETTTQFIIGKGTELEAIKTFGTIKEVKLVGKTVVRGQGVEIFEFKIGKSPLGKPGDIVGKQITTQRGEFVSGTGALGTTGTSTLISFPTTSFISAPTKPFVSPFISPPISPAPSAPTSLPSPFISPGISPLISPPTTTTTTPFLFPQMFLPGKPPKKKKRDIGFEDPFKSIVAQRKFVRTPSLLAAKQFEEFGTTRKQLSKGLEQTGLFERGGVIKPIEVGSLIGKVKKSKGRKKK